MLIHIKRNAEIFGPYSIEEAREYLSAGRLSLSDFAQLPGTTEWIPLASVPGVKSAPPPPPPSSAELPGTAPGSTHQTLFSAASTGAVSYAGFWNRFAAYVIDVIILLPINLVLTYSHLASFLWLGTTQVTSQADMASARIFACILECIIWWIYLSVLLSCPWQASLGMKACGLKITDEGGNRISFGRATGRWFAMWLSGCPTLGIGFLMIAWTHKKQGLHDLIARTLVWNVSRPLPLQNFGPPTNPPKPKPSSLPVSVLAIFCLTLTLLFGLIAILAFAAGSPLSGSIFLWFAFLLTLATIFADRKRSNKHE
jgi:uncharacterized RDD family membrane protein YckC